jgi:hypothetical protein
MVASIGLVSRLARIIHVGWNKIAQTVAGTAQLGYTRSNTLCAIRRLVSDRSSGSIASCSFRPTPS